MELTDAIRSTEQKYRECFCRRTRDGFFTKYADPALPDMYCHNMLWLKKPMAAPLLYKELAARKAAAKEGGAAFFRLELAFDPVGLPGAFPEGGEAEHNGLYLRTCDAKQLEAWPYDPACAVRRMTQQADAAQLTAIDLSMDEATCGRDFCIRRAERKTRVYVSDPKCRGYLAWVDGEAVGTCSLFLNGAMAKIENLCVRPDRRHRGAAATLLRALALEAAAAGCTHLCLMADEDDTPKKMYEAKGFVRADETWGLTWRL